MWNSQTPYCNYTTFNRGVPDTPSGDVVHPAELRLKKMEFVDGYAQRRRHEGNQGGV